MLLSFPLPLPSMIDQELQRTKSNSRDKKTIFNQDSMLNVKKIVVIEKTIFPFAEKTHSACCRDRRSIF